MSTLKEHKELGWTARFRNHVVWWGEWFGHRHNHLTAREASRRHYQGSASVDSPRDTILRSVLFFSDSIIWPSWESQHPRGLYVFINLDDEPKSWSIYTSRNIQRPQLCCTLDNAILKAPSTIRRHLCISKNEIPRSYGELYLWPDVAVFSEEPSPMRTKKTSTYETDWWNQTSLRRRVYEKASLTWRNCTMCIDWLVKIQEGTELMRNPVGSTKIDAEII